ncbi:hypothetical protein ACFE04_017283 [Oxalis oulophora]
MGISQYPLLNLNKILVTKNDQEKSSSTTSSNSKRCCNYRSRARKVLIKNKRKRLSRKPASNSSIEKKVKTLKKLIPRNTDDQSMGLDGLFRETADYILSLQIKVRVMQLMINELAADSNE